MAVQTITYDNKSFLNQNSDIADVNKCNDTDMNMIKSVVNNNANETHNIIDYFNLNDSETITTATISGGGSITGMSVVVSQNSSKTLAKISGQIDVATNGNSGNITIETSLSPSTQITMIENVYRQITYSGYVRNTSLLQMTINTDGTIVIPYTNTGLGSSETCRLSIIGTLIFIGSID